MRIAGSSMASSSAAEVSPANSTRWTEPITVADSRTSCRSTSV